MIILSASFCQIHAGQGGENSRHALLHFCYSFFTLGFKMLTGKNGGDIINLIQDGRSVFVLDRFKKVGLFKKG